MNTESFISPIEGEENEEERVITSEEIARTIDAHNEEIARLKKNSIESGENIDAPLGSEEYVDHGYMAQARELEMAVEDLQAELMERGEAGDKDAIEAAQRNLL